MTVLGRGDLAPPRHHHRRRGGKVLAGIVLLAVLGAGGYFGYHYLSKPATPVRVAVKPCPTVKPGPMPVSTAAVTLRVLNGTPRVGLAHRIADVLSGRGFRVRGVGNTRHPLHGASLVRYGAGAAGAAATVAEHVPGSRLVEVRSLRRVELQIGTSFHGLASPAEVAAARAHDLAAAHPKQPSCASPSRS